jgi:hypothetical protein
VAGDAKGAGVSEPDQTDVVARAKAALEGITPGPWEVTGGVVWVDDVICVPDPNDPTGQTPMPERVQEKVCDSSPGDARFIAAARSLVPELLAEVEKLRAVAAKDRRLSGQANLLLARIVAAANLGAIDGADGFIESYNLPVGPIHKAIPFLHEQGIVVTNDGQIKNGPEEAVR